MSGTEQQEQEIVVGTVIGVIQKKIDTYQVEVSTGGQNPRRIWTKDINVVQQMQQSLGQSFSFMCGVSHWTNPQTNQPVRSLWLNGYGAPGAAPMAQQQPMQQQPPQQQAWQPQQGQQYPPQGTQQYAPPQQQQQFQQGPSPYEKDQRIMREAASKVAVQMLPFLAPENQNFASIVSISDRLVAYYEHGSGQQGGYSGDGAPGHTDDDIPF